MDMGMDEKMLCLYKRCQEDEEVKWRRGLDHQDL